MTIFNNANDYKRFIRTMYYYSIEGKKPRFSMFSPLHTVLHQEDKIVSIVTYCLMPNHFHLLVRQEKESGISEFMRKLPNSYTKYINTKYNRIGPLLQGQFKAVHIESNEQLIHVHRYIHINPAVNLLVNKLEDYLWSSYKEYLSNKNGICNKNIILEQFTSLASYKEFIHDQIDYGKTLEVIKHKLFDEEN